jgi:hypothetical protein
MSIDNGVPVPVVNQRHGMGTAVDPKPNLHGSGLILVGWIRIPMGCESGPRGQKWPTRKEKEKEGIVLTCLMFFFEG